MQKDYADIIKEIQKIIKVVEQSSIKELNSIKNYVKKIDNKVSNILQKIEELEIVMELEEIMEEESEESDNYNTEWDPYEDGIDNGIYDEEIIDEDDEDIG